MRLKLVAYGLRLVARFPVLIQFFQSVGTKPLYSQQKIRMKKILLTGGAGYIGSHIAVALVEAGFEPIIVDNFSNSDRSVIHAIESIVSKKITFHEADCCNFDSILKIIEKEKTIVGTIHLAAYKAVGESVEQPLKYYENNIGAMTSVLRACSEAGLSNFVFSSSCTVYGTPEEQPVTEESPWQVAFSPYGYTKQVCEHIMSDFQNSKPNIKQVSLRYFNPIGAHPSGKIGELPIGKPNNLVPYLTQVAAGIREKLTVFGNDYNTPDGTCVRDYIHVVDLAAAHVSALRFMMENNTPKLSVFNIGTGYGVSVKEIIELFQEVNDMKVNVEYGPRRLGDVEAIYANSEKANRELGWKAVYSTKDALKHAWKWEQNLQDK